MPVKSLTRATQIAVLNESSEIFRYCLKKTKILAALSWEPHVAQEFFAKKEQELPHPTYKIDVNGLSESLAALLKLAPKLKGEHPVLQWLTRVHGSIMDGVRLLLELETDSFYEICTRLYGNSQSKPFESPTSNLELADSIAERMSACSLNDIGESLVSMDAYTFAGAIDKKLKERAPPLPVRVEITDGIVAKVAAGMNQVRIRKDARFSELDVSALWNHEIESHCLTAHNGNLQENCDFLYSGGPRTTMTQEGLSVFFEIYGHTMSQRRFLALCDRVKAIRLVEEGANFIDLYRWYRERSDNEMDAFYATQRIFRGAKPTGGKPFTKDVVYLGGLLGVFNFLRIAVKNQNRLLVEGLVCGRISLEDVGVMATLRAHGILNPPHFVPDWLRNWEALLSFFSFNSFVANLDLSSFQAFFDSHNTLQDWDFSL